MGNIKVKNLNRSRDVVDKIENKDTDAGTVYVADGKPRLKVEKPGKGKDYNDENDNVAFSRHDIPTEQEIREEEIDESLMEIYQDDNGGLVNVSKLDHIKKKGFFYYFFTAVAVLAVLGGGGWYGYENYYLPNRSGSGSVELEIDAVKEVITGEEFIYTLVYKNLNNVGIRNIELRLIYPENFVFLEAEPLAGQKNNVWQLGDLEAHRSGQIKIKGKIVGPKDQVASLSANMTYMPANFSSEFRKDVAFETVVNRIGIDFNFSAQSSVLVNETNGIAVRYSADKDNFIGNFRLTVSGPDNFILATSTRQGSGTSSPTMKIDPSGKGIWTVNAVTENPEDLDVRFRFNGKKNASEEIILSFEYSEDGSEYYEFLEKKFTFEIIKNDLNLNLILNGSRNDQGIDFDQILNYSIVYANKGDEVMDDIVIMAVLNSDILDWAKLDDKSKGKVRGSTISWSKEEIPALESLSKGSDGTIDFSIKVVSLDKVRAGSAGFDPNRKYEVQSYVQFSIGNREATSTAEDTRSNVISSKVNSDLKLDEQLRYFNNDNLAVGTGPVPPKVGQTTGFKVYWTMTNNLHELNNLKAEVVLPAYVAWDQSKSRSTVGSLIFDGLTRKLTWDIGRLPIDVYQLEAEFGLSITPTEADTDTILVLLPGTIVTAVDNVTDTEITKTTKAKTTKMEDDEIAAGNSDGRIVR